MSYYTGQRTAPIVEQDSPKPMKKGIVECAKCGRRIRPGARKTPHEDGPQCKAQVIVNAYAARDWWQASSFKVGELIERAGAPVEWALGGYHVESQAVDEFGHVEDVVVQHKVAFAPASVLNIVVALARIELPAHFRLRAIRVLWSNEDATLAIDSAKRLGAGKLKSLVHQLVMEAEERANAPEA